MLKRLKKKNPGDKTPDDSLSVAESGQGTEKKSSNNGDQGGEIKTDHESPEAKELISAVNVGRIKKRNRDELDQDRPTDFQVKRYSYMHTLL